MKVNLFYLIIVLVFSVLTMTSVFIPMGWAHSEGRMPAVIIPQQGTLKATAEISSQEICIDDLVEESWLHGRCSLDRKNCCLWNLNNSRSKTMTRRDLESALASNLISGVQLSLKGSEQITVTQTKRELTAEEVRAKILDKLHYSAFAAQGEITVQQVALQTPVYIDMRGENWEVQIPETLNRDLLVRVQGHKEDGTSVLLGWVRCTLSLVDNVYVAKRHIRVQESVRLEDFELRKINLFDVSGNLMQNAMRRHDFPENMRTKLSVQPGAYLTFNALERTPIVQLGDAVTLVLHGDNLKISTKGVAQGSGAVGDIISVQLKNYGRTFRGRLLEGRFVEVWL